jgi:hypothetical protein
MIDALLYTSDGDLYFIQISISPYDRHKTKAEHVLMEQNKGSVSVYEYFLQRTNNTQWHKHTVDPQAFHWLDRTHYLYITCSPEPSDKIRGALEVNFIFAEQLECLGGVYKEFVDLKKR